MFCLSKGLGAPVGSLLVGNKKFIEKAASIAKRWAAGCDKQVFSQLPDDRAGKDAGAIAEDHANAKFLAEGIADLPGVKLDVSRVQTNIVIFELDRKDMAAPDLARNLGEKNILASAIGPSRVRFVTHMDVDRAACAQASTPWLAFSRTKPCPSSSNTPPPRIATRNPFGRLSLTWPDGRSGASCSPAPHGSVERLGNWGALLLLEIVQPPAKIRAEVSEVAAPNTPFGRAT